MSCWWEFRKTKCQFRKITASTQNGVKGSALSKIKYFTDFCINFSCRHTALMGTVTLIEMLTSPNSCAAIIFQSDHSLQKKLIFAEPCPGNCFSFSPKIFKSDCLFASERGAHSWSRSYHLVSRHALIWCIHRQIFLQIYSMNQWLDFFLTATQHKQMRTRAMATHCKKQVVQTYDDDNLITIYLQMAVRQ